MKGFVLTLSGTVKSEWIDSNFHMNVSAYMEVFDLGTKILIHKSGLLPYESDSDTTLVAGRVYIEHKMELLEGDPWGLWSGFACIRPTLVTVAHRLRSGPSLCASCDILGVVFSKKKRASVLLTKRSIDLACAYIVPGLTDRFSCL